MIADDFDPSDELLHPYPSDNILWNESWLLSFSDAAPNDAGFFRIGLLPNQNRAWLWLFFNFGGDWFEIEEVALPWSEFDTSKGVAYDHRGLAFSYESDEAFVSGRFKASGVARQLTGAGAASLREIEVDLNVTATGPCFDTGLRSSVGDFNGAPKEFSVRRFEQPVRVQGTIRDGKASRSFDGYGQRDRSWGPRKWGQPFTLGDLHGPDLQLWFACGPDPSGGGIGYSVRDGQLLEPLDITGSFSTYGADGRLETASLHVAEPGRAPFDLALEILAPPLYFQVAHDAEPHEHFDYYRTLVRAIPSDGSPTLTGWWESNRIGLG